MIINFFSEGLPYFLKEKMRIYFLLLGEEDCGFLNFLTDIHDIEKDNIIIYQVHHLRFIYKMVKLTYSTRYLYVMTYEISRRGRREHEISGR